MAWKIKMLRICWSHVLIGLNRFALAIEAVYPQTEIQPRIIHQIRNSTKFVTCKEIKTDGRFETWICCSDGRNCFKWIGTVEDKWNPKYPKIYKSWHDNWATPSTYFKYSEAVRRLIYTTNAIEEFNHQFRKATKSKTSFLSDTAFYKCCIRQLWILKKIDLSQARLGTEPFPVGNLFWKASNWTQPVKRVVFGRSYWHSQKILYNADMGKAHK